MNDQFWITGNKKNSGTNFWTPKSASYITIVANLKKKSQLRDTKEPEFGVQGI